ncbi:MAG: glycosyltransferase family 39 protein [Candidatus Aquicultorales bacterium]
MVPRWEAPDEAKYFSEIYSLADKGSFVSFTGHPQLYSLAAYLPYRLAGSGQDAQVFAVRLIGVVCLVIAVWLTFKTANVVFPTNVFIQVAAPMLVAFVPQLSFIAASINSDTMLMMLGSALVYLTARMVRDGLDKRLVLMTFLVLLASVNVKQRAVILVPVVLIAIVYVLVTKHGNAVRKFFTAEMGKGEFVFGISALFVAFLFWPSAVRLYSSTSVGGFTFGKLLEAPGVLAGKPLSDLAARSFKQFWGYFGWLVVPMHPWFYHTFGFLSVLSLLGLVIVGIQSGLKWKQRSAEKRMVLTHLAFLGLYTLAAVFALAAYDALTGGGQGRYLFIAITPIAILFALGWSAYVGVKHVRLSLAVLTIVLTALNMGALLYGIYPFYY